MAAGGLPTVQVLLDNGAGAFPYDITTFARLGYTGSRGRGDEQSSVNPGTLTLILDNTDGRFTLGSTIIATPSPIRVDQRIRVKVTPSGGTTRNRFTQKVQSWPVEWPDGSDQLAICQIAGTDVQALGERQPLRSVIEEEVRQAAPSPYYTLGEPSAAVSATDSSGNQNLALTQTGTGAAVTFGTDTGPGTDGLTAAHFAGGMYLFNAIYTYTSTPAFIVAFASTSAAVQGILPGLTMSAGTLLVSATTVGSGTYNDGLIHVVAIRYVTATTADVYVDGVLTNSGVAVAPLAGVLGFGVGGPFAGGSVSFTGSIAHAAVFPVPPSGARLIAQSQAMLTGFAGESGTARITRIAGYANLPIGTLDTSLTNVAFVDITGKSVAEALRDVADAEFGLVFFDGSGNTTFHNRNRPVNKTAPDITVTADLCDPGTRFELDMQGVVNYFEATAVGTGNGPQIAWDKISEKGDGTATNPAHGRYPGSASYLLSTDQEALDRANWIVSTHASPQPRLGSLVFDLLTIDAATQDALLGAEPNTWLRVTGLPGQTPGGTTADFVVQGFSESQSADAWSISFNVANRAVAAPNVWILDDATRSVLDSTTRVFV